MTKKSAKFTPIELSENIGMEAGGLRQKAEELLMERSVRIESAQKLPSPVEAVRLLHELQVHQIELEMQNEELRSTHTELELSHMRYFELFDLAPVGYLVVSEKDRILEANLTVTIQLGVNRSQLLNTSFLRFIAAEDQGTYVQHSKNLFETGHVQAFDVQIQSKIGLPFWGAIGMTIALGANGAAALRVVISDISRRKNAELHLKQANEDLEKAGLMKDEFLASMSHELRTPLAGILGLAEALQLKTYGELTDRQTKAIQGIEKSGRHLLELINDLLDLARIGAGMLELQMKACSLNEICEASMQIIKSEADRKHIDVTFQSSPLSIMLQADARRVQEMVVNLLGNAIKFTPQDGSIGIEVHGFESLWQVHITVWDTGIGIKEEDIAHLFQRFHQLDAHLSRQFNGAGLGLALVKDLAELHGGSVRVKSVPGEGSRFTLVLPWQV